MMKKYYKIKRKEFKLTTLGFTLVELIAILVIISAMGLITFTAYNTIIKNIEINNEKDLVRNIIIEANILYNDYVLKDRHDQLINNDIYNSINVDNKPEIGSLIIDEYGNIGIIVKIEDRCYKKNYDSNTVNLVENKDCLLSNGVSKEKYICKRATDLHTENCERTDETLYCSGGGYNNGDVITYGSLGITGKLTSGDAFDCDVNGDGVYDAANERFYYVSDLSNNNKYAVLIYYSNTTAGVVDNSLNSLIAYDSNNVNYNGPITAVTNLPTTTNWSNVRLSTTSRSIKTENGLTFTIGGNLPNAFSYSGYAARLLTTQELSLACGFTVGLAATGELDTCNYLIENTGYSSNTKKILGYWLETPRDNYSTAVWAVGASYRRVRGQSANEGNVYFGVRPVIEVLKTDILY